MDFEDSEVASDSKTNSDSNTLKQKNEPIISFSPVRCRFDSAQSNSRKSSTIRSVADLQLEDPLDSSSTYIPNSQQQSPSGKNATSNLMQSVVKPSVVNHASIKGIAIHQIGQQQHLQHHFNNVPKHNQASQPQPYPFPHNQPSTSSAIINTLTSSLNSTSSDHSLSSTSKTFTGAPILPPVNSSLTSSSDANSISLMVNEAVQSTNKSASTAQDLQTRLERRIAQASAACTTSSTKTKASDNILSNIIVSSSSTTGIVNNNAIAELTGLNGNQISFSPSPKKSSQNMLGSLSSSLWESEPSASEIEELLWENKPSISEENYSSSTVGMTSFANNEDKKEFNVEGGKSAEELVFNEIAHGTTTSMTNDLNKENPTNSSTNNNNNTKANKSNKSVGKSQSLQSGTSSNTESNKHESTTASSPNSTSVIVVNSGFDMIRKVSALLPPQRLNIPTKHNKQLNTQLQSSRSLPNRKGKQTEDSMETAAAASFNTESAVVGIHKASSRNNSVSDASCNDGNASGLGHAKGNGSAKIGPNSSKLSSEKKPLVQWDSDESEEELSFFPPAKRGVITDNLSIDNMSLSGEEEDLHLTPPRPLARKCPCDPRSWLERNEITSSHHHHGDPTRNIPSKPCVIS